MDVRLDKRLFDWYSLVNINLEWNHLVYIILSMLTIGLRYCSMFNPRNCTFFCFVIITWGWVGTKKWWLCHNIICHNKVGWLGDHWNLLDVINFAVFFFLRASLMKSVLQMWDIIHTIKKINCLSFLWKEFFYLNFMKIQ